MRALPCLIVFCFVVFGCCLLESCSYSEGIVGPVEGAGGGLGRVEGRQSVVRVYCVAEDSILN